MKTCKKLLAITIALALFVTTLVSGLVVSAAEPYSVTIANTEFTAGEDATVNVTVDFNGDEISALHMLATIETTLTIADAAIVSVDYAGDYVDPGDTELEVPALRIKNDGKNLEAGKILFESGVDGAVKATKVVFALTFAAVAEGTYPIAVNVESTDYNEANFAPMAAQADIVVNPAHTCTATVPVDNGDGTHDVKCECGNVIVNDEAHNFVDGICSVCKAEEPVYEDANLKIRGAGITMANGFALDFKVRKTMETSLGYSDIYIEFQKPRYDVDGNIVETRTTVVAVDARTNDPTNSENYLYTLEGIQPQEVGTTITATIYGTKDGHVYKGATVEYSVLKFTTNQLKTLTESSTATALQTTCADIIMYGAAVQEYAKYNTANPIIDAADELCGSTVWQGFATAEITRELVNAQTNTPLDGATVRVRSAGVTLSSKVILYFNCADMGVTTLAEPDNYVVRVSYKNVEGIDRTYDLEI